MSGGCRLHVSTCRIGPRTERRRPDLDETQDISEVLHVCPRSFARIVDGVGAGRFVGSGPTGTTAKRRGWCPAGAAGPKARAAHRRPRRGHCQKRSGARAVGRVHIRHPRRGGESRRRNPAAERSLSRRGRHADRTGRDHADHHRGRNTRGEDDAITLQVQPGLGQPLLQAGRWHLGRRVEGRARKRHLAQRPHPRSQRHTASDAGPARHHAATHDGPRWRSPRHDAARHDGPRWRSAWHHGAAYAGSGPTHQRLSRRRREQTRGAVACAGETPRAGLRRQRPQAQRRPDRAGGYRQA